MCRIGRMSDIRCQDFKMLRQQDKGHLTKDKKQRTRNKGQGTKDKELFKNREFDPIGI